MKEVVQIYHNYAQTEAGQRLDASLRYAKYRPDDVTPDEWRGMFGADVNNLKHNLLTYHTARAFLRHMAAVQPGVFDERKAYLFGIGALTHDYPEDKLTDISFSDKTPEDIAMEKTTFIADVARYAGNTGLAEDILEAGETIVFDHTPGNIYAQAFGGIERLGYHRTSLRANQLLIEGHRSGMPLSLSNSLHWLVGDVLSNNTARLVEDAQVFVPFATYLRNQEPAITQAWDMIPADLATQFYGDKADARQAMIDTGRAVWDSWRQAN